MRQPEPFALVLYRRYSSGETVLQLAAEFGLPEDRVKDRIRAAARYSDTCASAAALERLLSLLVTHKNGSQGSA